mmetsp:Transcript_39941/g.73682  ORF Transcript_39941/g.73682 Transcript_39941/m.73682 type:complete len:256 (-) Transcript_39941:82-849(-)
MRVCFLLAYKKKIEFVAIVQTNCLYTELGAFLPFEGCGRFLDGAGFVVAALGGAFEVGSSANLTNDFLRVGWRSPGEASAEGGGGGFSSAACAGSGGIPSGDGEPDLAPDGAVFRLGLGTFFSGAPPSEAVSPSESLAYSAARACSSAASALSLAAFAASPTACAASSSADARWVCFSVAPPSSSRRSTFASMAATAASASSLSWSAAAVASSAALRALVSRFARAAASAAAAAVEVVSLRLPVRGGPPPPPLVL